MLTSVSHFKLMPVQESWYEKLNRWDEALEAYERKYAGSPPGSAAHIEAALGRLRYGLGFVLRIRVSIVTGCPVCAAGTRLIA